MSKKLRKFQTVRARLKSERSGLLIKKRLVQAYEAAINDRKDRSDDWHRFMGEFMNMFHEKWRERSE